MTVSRRRLLAIGLGALAVAGCTPRPQPLPEETPMPDPSTPSPATSVTPTPTPTPTPQEQARLDQLLRDAAWADEVDRAEELIAEGADVNAKDDTEQSAYLIATSEGHLELLRLCLAHDAEVDDKDSWNGTGLIRAAERGHHLVVGELLQAGIDRDHVNRIGYQAIHEAVWLGRDSATYHDTVRVLVAGGVELDQLSGVEQLTPGQMAEERGFDGTAAILSAALKAKAPSDPDAALLDAAEAGDADRVAIALRAGADLETRNGRSRTPLLLAAAADQLAVARLLLSLGADVNAVDDQSDTPVLVTGVTGSAEMLKLMLAHQPNFKLHNRFGGTALIPASERGHVDYVRFAVGVGIDINHVNDLGWTALLEAVILGNGGTRHQQIVEILLDHGADPEIGDRSGVTALQHARNSGQHQIVELLES